MTHYDPEEIAGFERIRRRKQHGHHMRVRGALLRCNGKLTYRTRKDAKTMQTLRYSYGCDTTLYVYRCDFCSYWHLTHKKRGRHHVER